MKGEEEDGGVAMEEEGEEEEEEDGGVAMEEEGEEEGDEAVLSKFMFFSCF